MKHRSKSNQDSLDLLLDTMCNAFGGIVLIAILVAILIESPDENDDSDNRPSGDDALQVSLKSRQLANAERELRELRKKREENREIIELIRKRNQMAKLLEARQQTESLTIVELNDRLTSALEEIAQKKRELAEMNETLTLVEAKIENGARELAEIEEQMNQLVASRTSETRPPELRDASGSQFNIILKHGKIYPLWSEFRTEGGEITGLTENDDIYWEGSEALPISGSGLDIRTDREQLLRLLRTIRAYNQFHSARPSERFFIALFVYGNSFEILGPLREMIEGVGGIKSGWEPMSNEQPLRFSTEGEKSQIN